MNNIFSQ